MAVAAHGDAVDSLRWAHNSLKFVSGSKDGCAALWTPCAGRWRHVRLRGRDDALRDGRRPRVTMVCWDRSDALVLAAMSDATVGVWCATAAVPLRSLRAHRDEVFVLEPHPTLDGVILSAGHDGQLIVWDAAAGEVIASHAGTDALFDAKWARDGTRVAACDAAGHLQLFGLGAGHELFAKLPRELFFHTDYRGTFFPQSPLLVDGDGAPFDATFQSLVPAHAPRLVPPPSDAELSALYERAAARLAAEEAEYAREMRRRPHMISSAPPPRRRRVVPAPEPAPDRSPSTSPPPSPLPSPADSGGDSRDSDEFSSPRYVPMSVLNVLAV